MANYKYIDNNFNYRDRWFDSPYYDANAYSVVPVGYSGGTETPFGVNKNSYVPPIADDVLMNAAMNGNSGLFGRLKNKFSKGTSGTGIGKGGSFIKQGGAFDLGSGKLGNLYSKLSNPQFDYSKTSGIQGWGKNLGKGYTIVRGVADAYGSAKNLQNMNKTVDASEDLMRDIKLSAANSPTIMYDINADQRKMLRELQRGTFDADGGGIDDINGLGVLGDAAMGAIKGIPGGYYGIIAGAIGGAAKSATEDMSQGAEASNAELEALYQAVLESEMYHNQMRKQQLYSRLY